MPTNVHTPVSSGNSANNNSEHSAPNGAPQDAPHVPEKLGIPINPEILAVLNFLALNHPKMSVVEFAYAFVWKALNSALSSGYTCDSARERFGKVYDASVSKGITPNVGRQQFIDNRIGGAEACEAKLKEVRPEKSL